MYKAGDKVVYPHYGAGSIQTIEERAILGKKRTYYVLHFPYDSLRVFIPTESCGEVGLRPIISSKEAKRVLRFLSGDRAETPDDWNRRYKINSRKLKTGDIFQVAEVFKDLKLMQMENGLSAGEKRLLEQAGQILMSELCYALDVSHEKVLGKIEKIFSAPVEPVGGES